MAETVTLNNLANLQNETTAVGLINANNAAITTAFADCLSRGGTSPNTMTSNLDMNSNRIVNLAAPTGNNDAARLIDVGNITANTASSAASAIAAGVSSSAAAASATAAAASATLAGTSSSAAAASASSASTNASIALAAAGFAYTWLSSTTNADPGTGKLKFDNATIGSVASIFISETDGNSNALAALIADWGASTSTNKSVITVAKSSSPGTVWADFYATAAVTDNGTWDTITVTYKAGPGGFTNNDSVFINATLVGDKGSTGSAGSGVTAGGPNLIAAYSASATISGGLNAGTNGQIVIGQTGALPGFSTASGGATISNTGVVTLGNPSSSALGGVQSFSSVATKFLNNITTSGVPSASQPNVTDVTGTADSLWYSTANASGSTFLLAGTSIAANNSQPTGAVISLGAGSAPLVDNQLTSNIRQNSQTSYTTVLADMGKHIYKVNSGSTATVTIASSAVVNYQLGGCLTFLNAGGASAGVMTIAINGDTLRLVGTQSSTGSRTLAAGGMATAVKTLGTSSGASTEWHVSGVGLT